MDRLGRHRHRPRREVPGRRPADAPVHRPSPAGAGTRRLRGRPSRLERAEARSHPDGVVRGAEGEAGRARGQGQGDRDRRRGARALSGRFGVQFVRNHMRRVLACLLACLVGLQPAAVWAQQGAAPGTTAARAQPRLPSRRSSHPSVESLGISFDRIKRELRILPPSTAKTPLKLEYYVEVQGLMPPLPLFRPGELTTGPVPYGAPTHSDMMDHVTPLAFKSPSIPVSSNRDHGHPEARSSGRSTGRGKSGWPRRRQAEDRRGARTPAPREGIDRRRPAEMTRTAPPSACSLDLTSRLMPIPCRLSPS